MAHPSAPARAPVPLPSSQTQPSAYIYPQTHTPTPSQSPSSFEAWRNRPKRTQNWSQALPPPRDPGEQSWGKGVGVGSAEWSGTTAASSQRIREAEVRAKMQRMAEERDALARAGPDVGPGLDKTDGGTEPTTFKNGRFAAVEKEERAGEVVREQRRLGSQGSNASRSVVNLPQQPGRASALVKPNLTIPIRPPGGSVVLPARIDPRPPPTPFLALPSPDPARLPSPSHTPKRQPPASHLGTRPVPIRSIGSDHSAHSGTSARSQRDAFIESALHLPIELLSAVQAEQPNSRAPAEPVRKSKSNVSQRKGKEAEARNVGRGDGEADTVGGSAIAKGNKGEGKGRAGGAPLEPVKTWPRETPRSTTKAEIGHLQIPSARTLRSAPAQAQGQSGLPARSSSMNVPHHVYAQSGPIASPRLAVPALPAPKRTPSPIHIPPPSASHLLLPKHTPNLRPALSRGGSADALGRRQRDPSLTNLLQTRFEPSTYPLPPSSVEMSPVRPDRHDQQPPVRALGSAASHKAIMPIRVEDDHSLTPGSSFDHNHRNPGSTSPLPRPGHRSIVIDPPSSDAHLKFSQPRSSQSSRPGAQDPTGNEGDRISFEIPSGTRGRLRVSLAWFRDSPRRWKDRVRSPRSEEPPPLPTKEGRWAREDRIPVSPRPRTRSPGDDRSPPRSRPHSPPYPPARSKEHLAPPERDRVRFSPNPPDVRSPPPWHVPPSNPYLHPGTPFIGSPVAYPPRPGPPIMPYPQPAPGWQGMPYPTPGRFPPPAPPSPRPSVDPSSDGSPPALRRQFPLPPPLAGYPGGRNGFGAPSQFPYEPSIVGRGRGQRQGQGQGQEGLPWSGRQTMWQRMFRPQRDDEHWRNGQRQGRDGKEGLIRNWRREVPPEKAGTTFIGGESGYEGNRRRPIWPFGTARAGPSQTQAGYPSTYPPPPRTTAARTNIFSRAPRPFNRSAIPGRAGSPIRVSAEDVKAARRAERKDRRDRRNAMQGVEDGRTTLHPFDSVTRAGEGRRSPVLPARMRQQPPQQQEQRGQRGQQQRQLNPMGTGRAGGMVRDWVKRVSMQPQPGVRTGGSNRAGGAWKDRLKARGERGGMAGGGAGVGIGAGAGAKLRRGDSGRQKQTAGKGSGGVRGDKGGMGRMGGILRMKKV